MATEEEEKWLEDARSTVVTSNSPFWIRLKRVSNYRRQMLDTLCVWAAFFVFGFAYSQAGPTLPDLQQITGVHLNTASWLFTAVAFGFITGCFLSGVLVEKVNQRLILFMFLFAMAVFTIVTPWCELFGLMLAARLCVGVCTGGIDTVGHAFLFSIWKSDGKTHIQIMYFLFATGGLTAPLATAPFLSTRADFPNSTAFLSTGADYSNNTAFLSSKAVFSNSTAFLSTGADYSSSRTFLSTRADYSNSSTASLPTYLTSGVNGTHPNDMFNSTSVVGDTNVHYSFLISGILSFCAAVPFLLTSLKVRRKPSAKRNDNNEGSKINRPKQPSKLIRYTAILMITFMFLIITGWIYSFSGFLMSFVLNQLNWSKSDGSFTTTLFWTAFAVGNITCAFLVQCFRTQTLLFCYCLISIISLSGLAAASFYVAHTPVLVCILLTGFSMSIMWPGVFMWTEEKVTSVTGRVASLFLAAGSLGAMLNPLAIGYTMDNITSLSFIYWTLGEAVALMILFVTVSALYWNVRSNQTITKEIHV